MGKMLLLIDIQRELHSTDQCPQRNQSIFPANRLKKAPASVSLLPGTYLQHSSYSWWLPLQSRCQLNTSGESRSCQHRSFLLGTRCKPAVSLKSGASHLGSLSVSPCRGMDTSCLTMYRGVTKVQFVFYKKDPFHVDKK